VSNPAVEAARSILAEELDELRDATTGLSPEGLNSIRQGRGRTPRGDRGDCACEHSVSRFLQATSLGAIDVDAPRGPVPPATDVSVWIGGSST
jgi:hypothetical protein